MSAGDVANGGNANRHQGIINMVIAVLLPLLLAYGIWTTKQIYEMDTKFERAEGKSNTAAFAYQLDTEKRMVCIESGLANIKESLTRIENQLQPVSKER